jgi:DNA-binding transcriptional LysR family regulator
MHLFELTPEQQLQAFTREEIDVGFTRPPAAADEKNFTQERIYRDRLMLAVPETHALAKAGKVRLEKFAGEDFVMFKGSEAPKLADAMTQLCAKAGFTPQVVSELPMIQTMLMAVAAGIGVPLVPGCVRCFRQPGVTIQVFIQQNAHSLICHARLHESISWATFSGASTCSQCPAGIKWREECFR